MSDFLPGVPAAYVRERLARAGGNEIESGKFASAESSAALAENCFAWFHDRPHSLPPFPGVAATYPAEAVDVEFEARFPWAGGRHPWLDAHVATPPHIVGVESKRFEPIRDKKKIDLSPAYDRPVWGGDMELYERMRDALRAGVAPYQHLDAAQLVKHAFDLVTQSARVGKPAVLVYLFAEPDRIRGRLIPLADLQRHRNEISDFSARVGGAAVEFCALSYREWLGSWSGLNSDVQEHGRRVLELFRP